MILISYTKCSICGDDIQDFSSYIQIFAFGHMAVSVCAGIVQEIRDGNAVLLFQRVQDGIQSGVLLLRKWDAVAAVMLGSDDLAFEACQGCVWSKNGGAG